MNRLFLYAHRGASADAPENTLAAFRQAIEAGADGVELDVHLSRDGVPVVIHDNTLGRTTDGTGPVTAKGIAALQRLDAGAWFAPQFAGEPLPSLEQALELLAGKLRLNLEVKEARAGTAVMAMLRRFPHVDAVVSSFDHALLRRLRHEDATMPLAVLACRNWHLALSRAIRLRACAFHPHADLVTRPLLATCRRLHLPVYPWTVDDPERACELAALGVDGLFTNRPGLLRRFFCRAAM